MGKVPKGCPSSFPDPPAQEMWLPRKDASCRQQHRLPIAAVAASAADRDAFLSTGGQALLPARGEAEAPRTAAVEEALSQLLMLPTVLEQRDELAFISS